MFRVATAEDLPALRDLERNANLAALGHVFPPERFPFPDDDVLARWALVMADPSVTVLVRDHTDGRVDDNYDGGHNGGHNGGRNAGGRGIDVLAAYDDTTLRHLAVHPRAWGQGLASTAIDTVLHAMDLRGSTVAQLWCLEENHRARRLYEYLGWRATPDRQEAPWPPHPTEMRYTRLIIASDR